MAPKKRLPLVDDEQPLSTKKPADKVIDEEDSSEEEGDEEKGSSSEEDQTPSKETKPVSENPPPSDPISNPEPAESGTESGSESGTETDSEPEQEHDEPTPPPNPKAQSTLVPAKSGTKRAAENNTANAGDGNDSKRAKKKTAAATAGGSEDAATAAGSEDENEADKDVKMTGEKLKKSSQRLFSEEDELTILKGLADFTAKTGKDPMNETAAFHSFVKKSMKAEANGQQLKRKVRSLKKKFETSENFTKPHDKQAFELFKKIWGKNGSNEAEEIEKANDKTAKSAKKEATIKNGGSANKEATVKDGGSAMKELAIVTTRESGKVEGGFDKSVILIELVKFDDPDGIVVLNKDAVKRGLELMGESNRVALEKKWKKQQIAEMEVFLNRAELIRDQSKLVLQELKKTSSD